MTPHRYPILLQIPNCVVYCFELQILEGSRQGGEFLLEGLPDVRGILNVLVRGE